ncbi:hypothetical protein RJ639_004983 [Escallonia herrerae]|uniref:GrpE protein homolog n=1 Tax=Escallonia herrerae TaxID=1293975 RepID=A0AA89AZ07_9ASTE|nr:hypothetical protein RJ639_004983 [Escallonia herrerae]
MLVGRLTSRLSRSVSAQCRNSLLISARQKSQPVLILSNQIHSLLESQNKVVRGEVSLFHHPVISTSVCQRFGFSSSASPQPNEESGKDSTAEKKDASKPSVDTHQTEADQEEESDSEGDVSMEDLVKLVAEKEVLLKTKQKEIEVMKDKVLRSYAEMENVMSRTKREAESSKKFAIQSFAKSLLDVADNLGRASAVVSDSFSKIDTSEDNSGAVQLLKTLLDGVAMTEKQLAEVFKKGGVEKYDPTDEEFDPNRHNAAFQVPDSSKPPNMVAVVLKPGYMLFDRVLRPAEVGVTVAVDNDSAGQGSEP